MIAKSISFLTRQIIIIDRLKGSSFTLKFNQRYTNLSAWKIFQIADHQMLLIKKERMMNSLQIFSKLLI